MPRPVSGSMPETDVVLVLESWRDEVTGKAVALPVTRSSGLVPVPSQPSVMEPNGARSVPLWEMEEAKMRRLPPAVSGRAGSWPGVAVMETLPGWERPAMVES